VKLHRNLCYAVVQNLESIFTGNKYADKVIEKTLKANPTWGARDRRFIAEATYDIVRWYRLFLNLVSAGENDYWSLFGAWCLWHNIELPSWDEIKHVKKNDFRPQYDRVKAIRKIRESYPDWLDDTGLKELPDRWDEEAAASNQEAKVVLRANTLKISVQDLKAHLEKEHVITRTDPSWPEALFLVERQNVFGTAAFRDGLFEVQDAASQKVAPFLQVEPGLRVIDACAGAGGKSLHLAALMQNKGRVLSLDTETWKLDELKKRARRASVSTIETRHIDSSKVIKRLEQHADRLLLDVPCSGVGVLKRNPDAKWKLSAEFIEKVKTLQQEILSRYSSMLKPGGLMVYSTCSIFPSENENQVKAFLSDQKGSFSLIREKTFYPSDGNDGFYMALMKKK
jgi:16S rRNA (cytosine967-C5)-methyltransferase